MTLINPCHSDYVTVVVGDLLAVYDGMSNDGHWVQYTYAAYRKGKDNCLTLTNPVALQDGECFCLSGKILLVAMQRCEFTVRPEHNCLLRTLNRETNMVTEIIQTIGSMYGSPSVNGSKWTIPLWNDRRERTMHDVLSVLERTITRLTTNETPPRKTRQEMKTQQYKEVYGALSD